MAWKRTQFEGKNPTCRRSKNRQAAENNYILSDGEIAIFFHEKLFNIGFLSSRVKTTHYTLYKG